MVTGMYSYETYASNKSKNNGVDKNHRVNVGYFKLVDDGDEALVRFVYDSPSEIVMAHVHDEPVGNNKHRRVLCLRENARDDMNKCPLCSRGDKYFAKVYLKLIEYVKDEQGKIVPQAKIWERPESFADTIVEYIDNYGGLKDVVFKVKRKGVRGSTDTNYILTPMPSTIYNESNGYVKDFSDFDNFYFYPHSFLSKTKEDIEEYIKTGDFPFHRKEESAQTQPKAGQENVAQWQPKVETRPQPMTQEVVAQAPQAPASTPGQQKQVETPRPQTAPSLDDNNPLMSRPRRRYDYN